MTVNRMHQISILGGGLAGLATARALTRAGVNPEAIAIIDGDDPARGSSSPCGMLHAFPGRSLEPGATTFDKLKTSLRWIRQIDDTCQKSISGGLFDSLPMVRPLDDTDRGRQMRHSWENHRSAYPEWFDSTWLSADQLGKDHPAIDAEMGAIQYSPAMVVRIDRVRRQLADQLRDAGSHLLVDDQADSVRHTGRRWRIRTDARTFETEHLVWACGAHLDDWFDLPAGPKAGEVLVVHPDDESAPLDVAVSGGGYVAPVPGTTNSNARWLAGATWFEPSAFDERDDRAAIDEIRQKTSANVPGLRRAEVHRTWRGVRFMLGHIAGPLVGPIPTLPDASVAGAFGSKGLLRIPWSARHLARYIVDNDTGMPKSVRASRIEQRWWAPDESRIAY
jgi:glycine/D-amino acid oxidase-like deaminating enzyme